MRNKADEMAPWSHDLVERIRARAYDIWLSEGCPSGRARIHWLRAEAEFREKWQVHSGSAEHLPRKDATLRGGRGRVTFPLSQKRKTQ